MLVSNSLAVGGKAERFCVHDTVIVQCQVCDVSSVTMTKCQHIIWYLCGVVAEQVIKNALV